MTKDEFVTKVELVLRGTVLEDEQTPEIDEWHDKLSDKYSTYKRTMPFIESIRQARQEIIREMFDDIDVL